MLGQDIFFSSWNFLLSFLYKAYPQFNFYDFQSMSIYIGVVT